VDATDASVFGGKAAQLGRAVETGLPVPGGVALAWPMVDRLAAGDDVAVAELAAGCAAVAAPLAVRSSGIGEDSASASFAGQHESVLNVDPVALVDAVLTVWRSARTEAALAYRRRLGLPAAPRVGVVVQSLVDPDVAGVLFDGNPVTGADELVVEAAWGLGESVVAGTVTPDLFRVSPAGEVLDRRPGRKEVELRPGEGGGTVRRRVPPGRAAALCLDDDDLGRLRRLAMRCREIFGGTQDLEWALAGGDLWLLQRRPRTA
jgi:pyruvate,water dikinase